MNINNVLLTFVLTNTATYRENILSNFLFLRAKCLRFYSKRIIKTIFTAVRKKHFKINGLWPNCVNKNNVAWYILVLAGEKYIMSSCRIRANLTNNDSGLQKCYVCLILFFITFKEVFVLRSKAWHKAKLWSPIMWEREDFKVVEFQIQYCFQMWEKCIKIYFTIHNLWR